MTKLVYSETVEFKRFSDIVRDNACNIAYRAYNDAYDMYANRPHKFDIHIEEYVDRHVSTMLRTLQSCYTDYNLTDSDTECALRWAINDAIHNVHEKLRFTIMSHDDAIKHVCNSIDTITEIIDIKHFLNDVLHCYTHDSDQYEYEGANFMFVQLEMIEASDSDE